MKRAIAKPRPALDAICDALVEFPIKRFSEPARDLPGQVMVSRRLIFEWCKCAGLLPADEKLPEGFGDGRRKAEPSVSDCCLLIAVEN